MKKCIASFILGAMVALSVSVFAESVLKADLATFEVYVKEQKFESDKPIVAINGSTYLPLKDIGTVLNVPVEWNAEQRRVEIDMKPIEVVAEPKKELQIKSNSLNLVSTVPIVKDNKHYVSLNTVEKYLVYKDGNYFLELPNKESLMVKSGTQLTEYSIQYGGRTYIDLEACGITYKVEDNILWIE